MRYILNSAVITAPGLYKYKLISPERAQQFLLQQGELLSTIGYQETADALSLITGCEIPVNRKIIQMEPGDWALVFRLKLRPGDDRLKVQMKGQEGIPFILNNCEIGLLHRIE